MPEKHLEGGAKNFLAAVKYKPLLRIDRLGKHLWFQFADKVGVRLHLSSTGWLMPGNQAAETACGGADLIHKNFIHNINDANIRFRFLLSDGQLWNYHDPRSWGKFHVYFGKDRLEECDDLKDYGPDWLKRPGEAALALLWHKSIRKVKDVLTDQFVAAGVGNYLACEACFLAGIHPHSRWKALTEERRQGLARAVNCAIAGASLTNNHKHWNVFLRAGELCKACGAKVEYLKDTRDAKRGSYFCPTCQPTII